MKLIYKILTLSIILSILGCGNSENEADISIQQSDDRIKISNEQFKQNNMALGSLEEKVFPIRVKVNGMIDVPPENKAVVNSIASGYIKTIPLLVGNIVKKGQKLATIESPEFVRMQQEYMEVKEQLNYLKSEYERQKTMFKEDIISTKVFLKAERDYKVANAQYSGLKKQLSMLNISPSSVEQGQITSVISLYAPISGSITAVSVSRGTYVSPTTAILEIIDNDHIHLELAVFEKDIMSVKKDQNIAFSIPEVSDQTYQAKVYLVGAAIAANRTIKVHGHPQDDSQHFLTGMFVNAEIITDTSTAIALSENAFVSLENATYVLVLDEEKGANLYFKQVKVHTGKTANGFTELIDSKALNKTDKVLISGAFSLIGD
jgi:cobalt-zinc-cadmium efflux system membrane fusion protein